MTFPTQPLICHLAGQIIATSHEFSPQNTWFSNGSTDQPLISGKPRLVKYYILARFRELCHPMMGYIGYLYGIPVVSRGFIRLYIRYMVGDYRKKPSLGGGFKRFFDTLTPKIGGNDPI